MDTDPTDTLPPPSETSRVLLKLDELQERVSKAVNELGDQLKTYAGEQRRQGFDLDLVMNSLQHILLELQLPDAAERVRQAVERRHPRHTNGDAEEKTPDTRGVQ